MGTQVEPLKNEPFYSLIGPCLFERLNMYPDNKHAKYQAFSTLFLEMAPPQKLKKSQLKNSPNSTMCQVHSIIYIWFLQ